MASPAPSEYDPYYEPYLSLVTEPDVLGALDDQLAEVDRVLGGVPEAEADAVHEPYTWTVKQVVGHCIDNERVFGYRAARYAAGDATPLPGYDQDAYVAGSDYAAPTLADLVAELGDLRRGNARMLRRLPAAAWHRRGPADGRDMSVRAVAHLLVGHLRHHLNILAKRLGR